MVDVLEALKNIFSSLSDVKIEENHEESRSQLMVHDEDGLLLTVENHVGDDGDNVDTALQRALPYIVSSGTSRQILLYFGKTIASLSTSSIITDVVATDAGLSFVIHIYLDNGGKQQFAVSVNGDNANYLDNISEMEEAVKRNRDFIHRALEKLKEANIKLSDAPDIRRGFIDYLHLLPVSLFVNNGINCGRGKHGSLMFFYKNSGVNYTLKIGRHKPEGEIRGFKELAMWKFSNPLKSTIANLIKAVPAYYDDETRGVTCISFEQNGLTVSLISELENHDN